LNGLFLQKASLKNNDSVNLKEKLPTDNNANEISNAYSSEMRKRIKSSLKSMTNSLSKDKSVSFNHKKTIRIFIKDRI
jgi:hypothetical protein